MSSRWADLKIRILSSIVLLLAVLFITWWHPISFNALVILGGLVLLKEWHGLTRQRGIGWIVLGVVYIGVACYGLMFLRYQGAVYIYFLIAIVASADIGAFFVGKLWGSHKIAPSISPGKSWQGLYGGIAATMLAMVAFGYYHPEPTTLFAPLIFFVWSAFGDQLHRMPDPYTAITVAQYVGCFLAAIIVNALGLAGDLFESSLKRRAEVKDSGTLIPGHGGLFDRMDALLPNAILLAVLCTYMLPIITS